MGVAMAPHGELLWKAFQGFGKQGRKFILLQQVADDEESHCTFLTFHPVKKTVPTVREGF